MLRIKKKLNKRFTKRKLVRRWIKMQERTFKDNSRYQRRFLPVPFPNFIRDWFIYLGRPNIPF